MQDSLVSDGVGWGRAAGARLHIFIVLDSTYNQLVITSLYPRPSPRRPRTAAAQLAPLLRSQNRRIVLAAAQRRQRQGEGVSAVGTSKLQHVRRAERRGRLVSCLVGMTMERYDVGVRCLCCSSGPQGVSA